MKKFLITLLICLSIAAAAFYRLTNDQPWWRLAYKRLRQPMADIVRQYSQQDCRQFSQTEKTQGSFEALVTGYCRPKPEDFASRQDFLCAVGLNCSCPAGRQATANCSGSSGLSWSACQDFDDQRQAYCHLTAIAAKPSTGQIAADWDCFKAGSVVNIGGRDYTVTDKGSAITGRRFDIWLEDCGAAKNTIGIYQVKIPQ